MCVCTSELANTCSWLIPLAMSTVARRHACPWHCLLAMMACIFIGSAMVICMLVWRYTQREPPPWYRQAGCQMALAFLLPGTAYLTHQASKGAKTKTEATGKAATTVIEAVNPNIKSMEQGKTGTPMEAGAECKHTEMKPALGTNQYYIVMQCVKCGYKKQEEKEWWTGEKARRRAIAKVRQAKAD